MPAPEPAPAPAQQVDPALVQMVGHVKMALNGLLQRCQAANPADKRKTDDIATKLDKLFSALDQGTVSAVVVNKLKGVCDLSNQGDFAGAGKLLAGMTKDHFGETSGWGPQVSRLMKMGQSSIR